jgi:hypothetical protein
MDERTDRIPMAARSFRARKHCIGGRSTAFKGVSAIEHARDRTAASFYR